MRAPALLTPVLALLLAAPALAAPELTKAEKAALKTCEKELLKLAKFAAKGKDYAAARSELKRGLEISPDSNRLSKELEKVEKKAKKGGTPKASHAEKLAEKRTEAHGAVALALAKAALASEKEAPARYERYLGLIQTRYPSKAALDELNLVYFKPYFRWISGTEAKLLEAGGDRFEGKLLDAEAVAGLNGQHSSWNNPWVLTDGVHELRTTVPLRQANQILYYVSAYRKYFLERFSSWDLRAPKGKLPIIVTKTQADLKQQMKVIVDAMGGGAQAGMPQGIQGAAYYLYTNSDLNPCFVTYEPTEATGTTFSIDRFEQLQIPLAHEVTHQIVFEYSKYDCNRMRAIESHFWTVEAIANYMGYHVFDGTGWKLTHPRTIPMGSGVIEGPFAHCVTNVGTLPNLGMFMAQSRQQFLTVNNYHYAATLAYFLLEDQGGKYRERFIELLEEVHKTKDSADSFAKAFPGVDLDALHAEWVRFVKQIKLD